MHRGTRVKKTHVHVFSTSDSVYRQCPMYAPSRKQEFSNRASLREGVAHVNKVLVDKALLIWI